MKPLIFRQPCFPISAAAFAFILAIPLAQAAEPVGITAIDVRSRIATAVPINSNTSKASTIRFNVADAALLKSLQIGQIVYADLRAKTVSLGQQDSQPCCEIVGVQAASPTQPGYDLKDLPPQ